MYIIMYMYAMVSMWKVEPLNLIHLRQSMYIHVHVTCTYAFIQSTCSSLFCQLHVPINMKGTKVLTLGAGRD